MAASGANRRLGFLPRNWAQALVAGLPIGIIAMIVTNRIVFLWLGVAAFGGGLLLGSVPMLAERLRIDLKQAKVATAAWDILWYGGYAFASAGVAVLGLWIAAGKAPLKSPPLMVMVIGFAMLIEGLFVGLLIHPLEPGGKRVRDYFRQNGVGVRTFDSVFVSGTALVYIVTNYMLLRHLR